MDEFNEDVSFQWTGRIAGSCEMIDFDRLLKLRIVIASLGEMDNARWWDTSGQLGAIGATVLQRNIPRTYEDAAKVLPDGIRLTDLHVRLPRHRVAMLQQFAERDRTTVSAAPPRVALRLRGPPAPAARLPSGTPATRPTAQLGRFVQIVVARQNVASLAEVVEHDRAETPRVIVLEDERVHVPVALLTGSRVYVLHHDLLEEWCTKGGETSQVVTRSSRAFNLLVACR